MVGLVGGCDFYDATYATDLRCGANRSCPDGYVCGGPSGTFCIEEATCGCSVEYDSCGPGGDDAPRKCAGISVDEAIRICCVPQLGQGMSADDCTRDGGFDDCAAGYVCIDGQTRPVCADYCVYTYD